MPTATQPKIESPDRSWIQTNFYGLHDNCWVLNWLTKGDSLIVLAPTFGTNPINLGRITWYSRIRSGSRDFSIITDKFPVAKERYEMGMKVHLVAEATL